MLSLPADLQDLFQQIPENFEHGDQLFFRKDYCVSSKKSGDKFRYWLADTGEEVSVNWHSFDGQIGILTARWGALPRPVILGKDPSYTRQGFKPWKGVGIGFGPNDDDRNLVVKAQGKPDWVDQVRHHGASFDNTVLGKRSERSWESEADTGPAPSTSTDRAGRNGARIFNTSTPCSSSATMRGALSADAANITTPNTDHQIPDSSIVEVSDASGPQLPTPGPTTPAPVLTSGLGSTSMLDSLQITFTPAKPDLPAVPRPWDSCNTIRKLFSQALVQGLITRGRQYDRIAGYSVRRRWICGNSRYS